MNGGRTGCRRFPRRVRAIVGERARVLPSPTPLLASPASPIGTVSCGLQSSFSRLSQTGGGRALSGCRLCFVRVLQSVSAVYPFRGTAQWMLRRFVKKGCVVTRVAASTTSSTLVALS